MLEIRRTAAFATWLDRLYFVRRGETLIVLLCGGDKKSQERDIARAKALAATV